MPSVSERVIKVIAAELKVPESSVSPASNFVEDLGVDSLGATRLAMALETEFSCTILDDDADVVTTVEGMVAYIEGRITA